MSPTPGRSTLITSAPIYASSCVQVGPACTCEKSRMRTPSSALPAWPYGLVEGFGTPFATTFFDADFFAFSFATFFDAALDLDLTFVLAFLLVAIVVSSENSIDVADLFLAKHALRVEIADPTAFAARCRIDHRVDEGRLAGIHGPVHGAAQFVGCRHVGSDAAERFDDLVVARILDEGCGRWVRTAAGIDVGSAIDAVIIEDDDANRKVVSANRLHLHSAEAKRAVAFDGEHAVAGLHSRRDGEAHADAHDAPGADIEPFARLVHVGDATREIERVGAFVDQGGIRPLFDDAAH